ncbi:MAG: hypothetical protein ACM3Q1_18440 [Bacteroidales bacterium]
MRKQVTYVAVMALMLSSCVTGQPGGLLATHSANPNDVCGQAHADLFNSRGYFERSIAEGALAGAAAGALLGLAIGAASGKNMGQSAAIGAGAGLLVGGMGGYLNARQQQAKDNQELAGIVDGDIDREAAEVTRATVNFQRVSDCRKSASERIKADYRAGIITREKAKAKLDEQKALFQQELAEAEAIGAKIADRRKELNLAADKVLGEDPNARTTFESNQLAQAQWEAQRAEEARVAEQARIAEASTAKAKAKSKPKATVAKAAPPPPPPPTVEPPATSKNAYNVAVKNDNLNKRSGDYATAVEDGKKLVASGGFDLAG